MPDFHLRPYFAADAPAVVDLVNADAVMSLGVRRAVVDGAGNVRLTRYVPVSSERQVALDRTGAVAGYAWLADRDQSIVFETGCAVHPSFAGQGVGEMLLAWAEQRAMARSQRAPAGVKTVLQANLFPAETVSIDLFQEAGFKVVREWLHLAVELTQAPPAPLPPPGVRLRPMDLDTDWDDVGPAMDEAFAGHWGAIELPAIDDTPAEDSSEEDIPEDESYSNSPGFCFLAVAPDGVAGGVLCNARLVEREDSGRVGSLFVRPRFQRQGVGRALMLSALGAFWRHGLRRVILDTDAASFSSSMRLYGGLGMSVYRREFLVEKPIRDGREVRRLTM